MSPFLEGGRELADRGEEALDGLVLLAGGSLFYHADMMGSGGVRSVTILRIEEVCSRCKQI